MLENVRISLRGIWSHKMRSLLTMLGIIIGIAAIIAIVSTIEGTNEQIKQNLVGSGTNAVEVQLYQNGYAADFSYQSPPANFPEVDESTLASLAGLDDVTGVALYHKREWVDSLYYLDTSLSGASVVGVGDGYLGQMGLEVERGRGFDATETAGRRAVALVDETVVSSAFGGEDPLGKTIDVQGVPFVVVGVVRQRGAFEPTIGSISDYYTYEGGSAGSVYIPDRMWPVAFRYDEPACVVVRASSTDAMSSVGKAAADLLNARLPDQGDDSDAYSYQANDLAEQASQLQQLASSTNAMLIGIASISLLVGGIGVMNIMLVSVTERTREIGLKKALGAPRSAILLQFLTEAVMLSLMGGVLGVVAGVGLSFAISAAASVPMVISPAAVLVAVLFSLAVGVAFGLVPSIKAANLTPIDALRYE